MLNNAPNPPGTVSKILWHFTGGPTWNAKRKRQNKTPKPAGSAYANLISILKTRELRLGQYKEVLNVEIGTSWSFDPVSNRIVEDTIEMKQLTSAPVCCLSDIPVAHLAYHSNRYGKFAVGFRRDSVIRGGFNPVFYSLEGTRIIKAVYHSSIQLENSSVTGIFGATEEMKAVVANSVLEDRLSSILDYIDAETMGATEFAMTVEDRIGSATSIYEDLLSGGVRHNLLRARMAVS